MTEATTTLTRAELHGAKDSGRHGLFNVQYCNYIQYCTLNKPFRREELCDKKAVTDLLMQGVALAQATAGDNAKNSIRR